MAGLFNHELAFVDFTELFVQRCKLIADALLRVLLLAHQIVHGLAPLGRALLKDADVTLLALALLSASSWLRQLHCGCGPLDTLHVVKTVDVFAAIVQTLHRVVLDFVAAALLAAEARLVQFGVEPLVLTVARPVSVIAESITHCSFDHVLSILNR